MLVTLSGIVTETREVQPYRNSVDIVFTVFGMWMLPRERQSLNTLPAMLVI